jgi:hypothetical protein
MGVIGLRIARMDVGPMRPQQNLAFRTTRLAFAPVRQWRHRRLWLAPEWSHGLPGAVSETAEQPEKQFQPLSKPRAAHVDTGKVKFKYRLRNPSGLAGQVLLANQRPNEPLRQRIVLIECPAAPHRRACIDVGQSCRAGSQRVRVGFALLKRIASSAFALMNRGSRRYRRLDSSKDSQK